MKHIAEAKRKQNQLKILGKILDEYDNISKNNSLDRIYESVCITESVCIRSKCDGLNTKVDKIAFAQNTIRKHIVDDNGITDHKHILNV